MIIHNIILFLSIFGSIPTAQGSITIQEVSRISTKCCNEKKRMCCDELIQYGTTIHCGYEKGLTSAKHLYSCIQTELFKDQDEKKMEWDEGMCCQVFANNQNDPRKRCETTCKKMMLAPSIDAETRLDTIQKCTILSNPLFECFNKCRQLRKENVRAEVLNFDEYCNSTYLQKDVIGSDNFVGKIKSDNYHRMV